MKPAHEDVDTCREHVNALCRAFDIRLYIQDGLDNGYSVKGIKDPKKPHQAPAEIVVQNRLIKVHEGEHLIIVGPINSHSAYAVALHELGHARAPLGMVTPYEAAINLNLKIDMEHAAWEWAYMHALCWNEQMEATKRKGMDSYIEALRRQRYARARTTDRLNKLRNWAKDILK